MKAFLFIIVLRAIAAIIITNSHYVGIYPSDILASGGLLGDVLFFSISGFCLQNVKLDFFSWYRKRLIRIYIPVLIITLCYMFAGFYTIKSEESFFNLFIWPTNYHFVGSIVLLYVPFYFFSKYLKTIKRMSLGIGGIVLFFVLIYIFLYDKSYYHIDVIREPMI